jgi:hypothetical protein
MAKAFLQVDTQPEVGEEGYDAGAAILRQFFATHVQQFLGPSLAPKARQIIECCLDDGSVEDYARLLPGMDEMVEPTDASE